MATKEIKTTPPFLLNSKAPCLAINVKRRWPAILFCKYVSVRKLCVRYLPVIIKLVLKHILVHVVLTFLGRGGVQIG
jgi:hypothetical protein